MSGRARIRLAAGAMIVAAVVLAVTVTRAVRLDATAPIAAAASVREIGPPIPMGPRVPVEAALRAAAERNAFHPERRRGGAYRLPGRGTPEPALPEPPPWAAGPVGLVGTAVSRDGRDFVVCQAGREPPRIVRLGGSCGELVLESVEQGRATFRDPAGERVVLEVPKAGIQ